MSISYQIVNRFVEENRSHRRCRLLNEWRVRSTSSDLDNKIKHAIKRSCQRSPNFESSVAQLPIMVGRLPNLHIVFAQPHVSPAKFGHPTDVYKALKPVIFSGRDRTSRGDKPFIALDMEGMGVGITNSQGSYSMS